MGMASAADSEVERLRDEIAQLKATLAKLSPSELKIDADVPASSSRDDSTLPMPLQDYRRYGRQMILDGFGLPAQLKLRNASVLVVGAGGLGCPALQYLAAAGVGTIGIVDHDTVELSNLHRQVLHTEARVGWPKALSAKAALESINSSIQVHAHCTALTPSDAVELLTRYDLILDCTDNAPTRYLLSDTCVALGKTLVSGAALKFDGQLCTYNLPLGADKGRGPCYRCLWPKPPRQEEVGSCEELGVLGGVTGVVGTLQAIEAIKIITGLHDGVPSLLVYSALSSPPFRSIKLRPKRPSCPACGSEDQRLGSIAETDYVAFCGGARADLQETGGREGRSNERIRAKALQDVVRSSPAVDIIDVRPPVEYSICHIPGSRNIPLRTLLQNPASYLPPNNGPTYVVCKLGNDSQLAAQALREAHRQSLDATRPAEEEDHVVLDVVGGLRAWSLDVDPDFPIY